MGQNYVTTRAMERDLPMFDSEESIVVEVTKADVRGANAKNPNSCALSRACRRGLRGEGVVAAYFFRTCAWLEYGDKMVRYTLPPSVQKEIVSFDRGAGFAPGVYQMSKVPMSQTQEAQAAHARDPKRHVPKNTGIKRRVVHRTEFVRNVIDPDRE